MSSSYFELLDEDEKKSYIKKLYYNGIQLPDPLDADIRNLIFSSKNWPNISVFDIYSYLVVKHKVYTQIAFKSFETLPSYNYVTSGKVHNMKCFRSEIGVCVVTADVEAGQKANKIHLPWIISTHAGEIISGHCTCMAGLGETCSHVAATLFFIEKSLKKDQEKPSCTSEPCKWKKTSKNVEPMPVANIDFKKTKDKKTNQKSSEVVPVASDVAFKKFLEDLKTASPAAAIFQVLSDDEETESEEETCNISVIESPCSFSDRVRKKMSECPLVKTDPRKCFYDMCHISDNEIKCIEDKTKLQGEVWKAERIGRLTASNFGRILRSKRSDSLLMEIMGYRHEGDNVDSLTWGKNMEQVARDKFFEMVSPNHVNLMIRPAGLIIDQEDSFLAATPDGYVSCDCHQDSLLEIKCPYSLRNTALNSVAIKSFFLNDTGRLKEDHVYFDQIQGQMGISRLNMCYFVTFTTVSLKYEEITFDELKWYEMKDKLNKFFFESIIPEILNGHKLKEIEGAKNDCICKGFKNGVTIKCITCSKCFHKGCVKLHRKVYSWTCDQCKVKI